MARALLYVSLLIGLGAVGAAAYGHLRELRRSLADAEQRALRAELSERAREVAADLMERLEAAEPTAIYDRSGVLRKPAPPAEARHFVFPEAMASLDLAVRWARSSRERAAALVARGVRRKDPADLERALAEPALRGTDLEYRVRLELFRLRKQGPDESWRDEVSALLTGPSRAYARAMLEEAGCEPVGDPEARKTLAALRPAPGVLVHDGRLCLAQPTEDRLFLRSIPMPDFGAGPLEQPLPPPFEGLRLRAAVDPEAIDARLGEQVWVLAGAYGLVAVLLAAATVFASFAVGRALRLAQAKSDFVANVSHELRTPLANIRLYAESLREGRVRSGDQTEFHETILNECGRLDTLVEGLLHAARGPRLTLAAVKPQTLLRSAEERWRPLLEREGFELTVTAPPLPAVRGDREALLRALGNLLDNARKYSTKDPRVELSGAKSDAEVRLTVTDHGPGIPVAERRRVLEPFTRLEGADRKETAGTGLGLSLVLSTMEAHGGRVEIGDDSAVTLVLPREER